MNVKLNKARHRIELSMTRFYVGIVIGLLFSLVLFLFLSQSYFISNLIASGLAREVWQLPEDIFNFYSLFIASISVTTGLGETLRFWFHKPRMMWSVRKSRTNEIFAEQRFLQYGFLSLLLRAVVFLFFLFGGYYNSALIVDIHESYGLIFFFIPITLFFTSWLSLLKTYGRQAQKWMFVSFLISTFVSLGIAQMNNSTYDKLHKASVQFDPIVKRNIDLPKVFSGNRMYRRSLLIDGITMSLDKNEEVCYFIGDSRVIPEAIESYIKKKVQIKHSYEFYKITCLISADKKITMENIDHFKTLLWGLDVKKIAYLSDIELVNTNFYFYARLPFKEYLRPYQFGESYEPLTWEGHSTKISLRLKGEIEIDGIAQPIENILALLTEIKAENPEGLIEINYKNTTPLGDYLQVLSAHRKVFWQYRESKADSVYGEPYDYLEREQKKEIRKKFRFHFTTSRID